MKSLLFSLLIALAATANAADQVTVFTPLGSFYTVNNDCHAAAAHGSVVVDCANRLVYFDEGQTQEGSGPLSLTLQYGGSTLFFSQCATLGGTDYVCAKSETLVILQ